MVSMETLRSVETGPAHHSATNNMDVRATHSGSVLSNIQVVRGMGFLMCMFAQSPWEARQGVNVHFFDVVHTRPSQ